MVLLMRISKQVRVIFTLGVCDNLIHYEVDRVSADDFMVRPRNSTNFRYRVSNADKDNLCAPHWFAKN
jgi:hypothetical protein